MQRGANTSDVDHVGSSSSSSPLRAGRWRSCRRRVAGSRSSRPFPGSLTDGYLLELNNCCHEDGTGTYGTRNVHWYGCPFAVECDDDNNSNNNKHGGGDVQDSSSSSSSSSWCRVTKDAPNRTTGGNKSTIASSSSSSSSSSKVTSQRSASFVPNVLYMLVTSHRPDWPSISKRCLTHPGEVHSKDRYSHTPLHHVLRRYRPHHFRTNFSSDEGGSRTAVEDGFSRWKACVQELVRSNPSALTWRSGGGKGLGDTPLNTLCHLSAEVECSLLELLLRTSGTGGATAASASSFLDKSCPTAASFVGQVVETLVLHGPHSCHLTNGGCVSPLQALYGGYRKKIYKLLTGGGGGGGGADELLLLLPQALTPPPLHDDGDDDIMEDMLNKWFARFVIHANMEEDRQDYDDADDRESYLKMPEYVIAVQLAQSYLTQSMHVLSGGYCGRPYHNRRIKDLGGAVIEVDPYRHHRKSVAAFHPLHAAINLLITTTTTTTTGNNNNNTDHLMSLLHIVTGLFPEELACRDMHGKTPLLVLLDKASMGQRRSAASAYVGDGYPFTTTTTSSSRISRRTTGSTTTTPSSSSNSSSSEEQDGMHATQVETALGLLLRYHPQAASKRDGHTGRLPLHVAIEKTKDWVTTKTVVSDEEELLADDDPEGTNGNNTTTSSSTRSKKTFELARRRILTLLARCSPDTLRTRDVRTHLYPFLHVAMLSSSSSSTAATTMTMKTNGGTTGGHYSSSWRYYGRRQYSKSNNNNTPSPPPPNRNNNKVEESSSSSASEEEDSCTVTTTVVYELLRSLPEVIQHCATPTNG